MVVAADVRPLETFPERNLDRDGARGVGLQGQYGQIQQGTHVIVHRLAVEVLEFVIH